MTEDDVQQIWATVTHAVMADPEVGPAVGAQLALAVPRGVGGGTLYLAVQHDFTLKLLENRLRQAIMHAMSGVPEAHEIENFIVLVDPDAQPAIDPDPGDVRPERQTPAHAADRKSVV